MVDAYIDRFILAAHTNSGALKIKLFEKFGNPDRDLFNLTSLLNLKDKNKGKPLDLVAIFNDHERAQ